MALNELERIFLIKKTENGDDAYTSTGNNLLDLLFMSEYYGKHLDEVKIGTSDKEKLFAMFMRDGRFGLGRRDLGRELMKQAQVDAENIVKAGRYDDLIFNPTYENLKFLKDEVYKGNELAKKWCPRLTCKDGKIAKVLCSIWDLSEKQYRKLIKVDTTENKLSHHRVDEIEFEKVPSLAMIKYYKRFLQEDRFAKYLESVKKGEKKLNMSTTTVYDIYKNRESIDADLFFEKLEKIKINCIPVLDTSGSMEDMNDSIGKATCIAHYLAKCSTFCNGQVVSFSSKPQLLTISDKPTKITDGWGYSRYSTHYGNANKYCRELNSLYTGDCSNTDFGKVMELFANLKEVPEYLVVLSDMEFDRGSSMSKEQTMKLFKEKGYKTKIVWWNFNDRNKTIPETDDYGNVYISGYSPNLLKFLECGFDGNKFLDKLLEEYAKNIK